MSYGKEAVWMKVWCILATSMMLIFSATLSASCLTVGRTSNSRNDSSMIDQSVDPKASSISYTGGAIQVLLRCIKTGLEFVKEHPLKALTMFLALEGSEKSFRVPSVSGLIILSGTNKTLIYDSTMPNPEIFRPIRIFNNITDFTMPMPEYNVTVKLGDITAGSLTSNGTELTQKFVNGVWSTSGNLATLTPFIDNLRLKISSGFNRSFNLNVEANDLTTPTSKITGIIQVAPCTTAKAFAAGVFPLPLSIILRANDTTHEFSNPETVLNALSNSTSEWTSQIGVLKNSLEACIINEYRFSSSYSTTGVASLLGAVTGSGFTVRAIFLDEDMAYALVANDSSLVAVHKVHARLDRSFQRCCQSAYSQCCPQYTKMLQKILEVTSLPSSPQIQSKTSTTSISSSHIVQKMTDLVHDTSSTLLAPSSQSLEMATSSHEPVSSTILLMSPSAQSYDPIIGGAVGALFVGGALVAIVVVKKRCAKKDADTLPVQALEASARIKNDTYSSVQFQPNTGVPAYQSPVSSAKVLQQQGYINLPGAAPRERYAQCIPQRDDNADPLAQYEQIFSTLYKAAQEGDCGMILMHLDLGLQINKPNEEGYTALHLAAMEGHLDACKLLISRGAHKSLPNKDNKTASQLAHERGHNDIVSFLELSSDYKGLPVAH